ncbi:MAG: S9 family peptidase, partial [Bacteroidota bacterium]
MRKLVVLCFVFWGVLTQAQEVTGSWKGTLSVQGMEMPLIFTISGEEGALKSTMDSPSQGATDIPMDETFLEKDQLTIAFKSAGIKYVGQVEDAKISGTFYQAGAEFPLVLEKTVKTIPENPDLPSSEQELMALVKLDDGNYKYSVEDYFKNPKGFTFRFSPNGKFLSYRQSDDGGKQHVYVKNLATGEAKKVIEEGDELIRGYGWLNNTRLYYTMDKGGDENYHVYAINYDGTNDKDLTPFEGVRAEFSELLKDDEKHIIVQLNKNNPQVFEP